MNRTALVIAGSLVLAGGIVYAWSARGTDDAHAKPPAPSPVTAAKAVHAAPAPLASPAAAPPQAPPPSVEQMAAWVADTQSEDPQRRASAIAALARAPRAMAVPALRQVLTTGETSVDRPLALKSLSQLALEQGDDDGSVRNVIREDIYHGDGAELGTLAQSMLDDVERGLASRRE